MKVIAQLEPYIKEAKQRPDLLVKTSNNIFAIEFQCAKISSQIFLKRTRTYQKHGYILFWILGGNQLKRVKKQLFSTQSLSLAFFLQLFHPRTFLSKSSLFVQIINFLLN
ncbi:hypothetical protein KHA80_18295 [Anaerobacillus sp. HL2]|nr:hypothetical protein KHA80_18295 [Anaerobacillus sp. HL2]